MTALLEARNLIKRYKGVTAVAGVSFQIDSGRCFGLLGPNGAGKTTTVEMLEGIKPPSDGQILYRDAPLGPRFRQEAGIMFQATALQEHLTVFETLDMFRRLYPRGLPLAELVAACALDAFLHRDTRKLSGGQRQRLLLAMALVNDPEVVFLDEPTTGLDPQARRNLWELVRGIKQRGKTVVLTTHYMEEAYVLCDEIIIMDHGRIIAQGTPQQLLAAHFNDVILELPRADLNGAQDRLGTLTVIEQEQQVEILTQDVNAALQRLLELNVPLGRLKIRERTLEDLFLELTGKELRP